MRRILRLLAVLGTGGLLAAPAAAAGEPSVAVPQGPGSAPAFVGAPATPHPFPAPTPPQNPFMAANGRSEIHDDGWQSDAYANLGPLGRSPQVSSTFLGGDCASVAFDRAGRILTVCVGAVSPTLYLLDPRTLATLASYPLPARPISTGLLNVFQGFGGGGYFYLDEADRVVVPTNTRHVLVIAEGGSGASPSLTLARDYDLSTLVASGDQITSVLPDWRGRLWTESLGGVLVTIDPATGATRSLALGEEAENSFAVDETGAVYVVTTAALYRLQAGPDGTPGVVWRMAYPNSGLHKPGQVDAGSGSTPTVVGPYVAITDNANPLDVVVYRRAAHLSGPRLVCVQPVLGPGDAADENSLIGAGNTLVAENNYGYSGPAATEADRTTAPGVERVDIDADGRGCHAVWRNDAVSVPTTVSKLSLAGGLIYTYTKDTASGDPWYLTAMDVASGRVVYRVLTGFGLGYNNNYAPVTLGPDGAAYVGVLGGLVEVRDAVPLPTAAAAPAPATPAGPTRARACPSSGRLAIRLPAGTRAVRVLLDGRRLLDRRHGLRSLLTVRLPGGLHGNHRLRIVFSGKRATRTTTLHLSGCHVPRAHRSHSRRGG